MVSIEEFHELRMELESGRMVEAWVDFSECGIGATNFIRGFIVDSFKSGNDYVTLHAAWPEKNEDDQVRWEGNVVTVYADGRVEAKMLPPVNEAMNSDDIGRTVLSNCVEAKAAFFSKRMERDEKYTGFEDFKDEFFSGHSSLLATIYEDYTLKSDGDFLGNMIRGQRLESWRRRGDEINFSQYRISEG
ncbi:unnamed protein product, partial [Notodromas monacha]